MEIHSNPPILYYGFKKDDSKFMTHHDDHSVGTCRLHSVQCFQYDLIRFSNHKEITDYVRTTSQSTLPSEFSLKNDITFPTGNSTQSHIGNFDTTFLRGKVSQSPSPPPPPPHPHTEQFVKGQARHRDIFPPLIKHPGPALESVTHHGNEGTDRWKDI